MADNTFNFDLEAPAVPTLTLDPVEAPAAEEKQPEPAAAPEAEQVKLSPEEQAMVDAFAQKIDITNSQQVLQYGSACQKKIGDFSEAALSKVSTKDLGEVGGMITDLIGELKNFDAAEEEKGILGFFKKKGNQLDNMKTKYSKAETNVETIQSALEKHQVQLLKDIAMLDKMYELNMAYFKELSMYILAGKKKLADFRAHELQQAMDKAKASGLPEDAQAARDLADQCERFEKKLYDLELTRTISLQMGPQIRLLQNNNSMMAEKIQSTIVNTIPLWKNQMVLALGLAHSQQAMQAERAVTDMTNELLKKNADALKMGTIETARESQRGVVDIETLQQTNKSLIETLDELNMAYFKELSMYILAGKKKLAEVRANELQQAMDKAKQSGLPEDAQAARDLADQCERFEKKLYDLELTRNISLQMGPQIRLLQNNNTMMAEKIQSTIVNTIPLWKNQMVLALGLAHTQKAMQAERAVTDMTNDLLKKNADALKMGTIETAKESQRGVVDIETLQQTNKSLIETLDELNKIQTEGRAKRVAAEQELTRIEDELKQKMMEIRS